MKLQKKRLKQFKINDHQKVVFFIINKMKNNIYDYLYFKIGEEFCIYEFEIIPIPPYEFIENGLSLELYEYFGDIKEIFGLMVKQIILYFNADILMKVTLKFRGNMIIYLKEIFDNLNTNLPQNLSLKLFYQDLKKETIIIYQNRILLSEIHQKAEI